VTVKIDASGRQIHCHASLLLIVDFVNEIQDNVTSEWDEVVGNATARAAGLAMIEQLEDRLEWPVYALIDWERSQGFNANKVLKGRNRVGKSYRIDDAIKIIREQLEAL
jgi:hypothetical protein